LIGGLALAEESQRGEQLVLGLLPHHQVQDDRQRREQAT
jgi:hypothetical protein